MSAQSFLSELKRRQIYRGGVIYVVAGWVFAAFRVLHSAMHCTANVVIVRFWLYAISALALWFMLIRAAIAYF